MYRRAERLYPGFAEQAPAFLDSPMEGTHSGYQRTLHPGSAAALQVGQLDQASPSSLVYFAFVPANPGISGVRGFCADSSGRICYTPDGAVPEVYAGICSASCLDFQ